MQKLIFYYFIMDLSIQDIYIIILSLMLLVYVWAFGVYRSSIKNLFNQK